MPGRSVRSLESVLGIGL